MILLYCSRRMHMLGPEGSLVRSAQSSGTVTSHTPFSALEFGANACPSRLSARIERDEDSPVRKNIASLHLADRLDGVPRTWHTAKPAIVLTAAVEPDDRGGEHLLRRRHRPVVRPPLLHSGGIHRTDVVVVAGWSDRLMMPPRSVMAEQVC